jgi:hypothetical protein
MMTLMSDCLLSTSCSRCDIALCAGEAAAQHPPLGQGAAGPADSGTGSGAGEEEQLAGALRIVQCDFRLPAMAVRHRAGCCHRCAWQLHTCSLYKELCFQAGCAATVRTMCSHACVLHRVACRHAGASSPHQGQAAADAGPSNRRCVHSISSFGNVREGDCRLLPFADYPTQPVGGLQQ